MTHRKMFAIVKGFRNTVPAKQIAKEHGVSVTTALRYFDKIRIGRYRLPRVLSIDEFRGNAGGEKFQTIITDAEHHIKLDILPNRKAADLRNYFLRFPRKERLKVKYVVMDMSSLFYGVMTTCFPKAEIVADRYHVVRQAIWAMEAVRKKEQKDLPDRWKKYCKHSKRLLNKNPEKLKPEELEKVRLVLSLSQPIENAYYLKNQFLSIMKMKDSSEVGSELGKWLFLAETAELPEFDACTKAVHNWFHEILNSFDCPYTNGYTEGSNNKIKVLKRVCFGVQNFERFRNRILFCC